MSKRVARKGNIRFWVAVEFLVGLVGIYGIGRLFCRPFKEARLFLIASLLLIVPVDFSPRLSGDQYALWLPWLIHGVLAAASAIHLNYVLDRKARVAKGR